MSLFKKYFSYVNVITERTYASVYNGTLEINWINGKKVLDTKNTNYSYGNLGKVLKKALEETPSDFTTETSSILLLGLGGGDVIKQLRDQFRSEATITAIDIDPIIIEIALNEFNIIPNNNLKISNADAQLYLKYTKENYDLIIVDLFNDIHIPEFVFENGFISSIFNALKGNGSAIFNTFILNDEQQTRNDQFIQKLNRYFSVKSFPKLYGHNHLLIAQKIK